MQRTVPNRADLESVASPHALLGFVKIEHQRLSETIRVVSDPVDYVRGGFLHTGIVFGFTVLSDEDQPPSCQMVLPNVDRRIGEALLAASDRATVSLEILSSADFDLTVEPRAEIGTAAPVYSFAYFELVDVSADAVELRGRVMLRDYAQEPWPRQRSTQTIAPGIYR